MSDSINLSAIIQIKRKAFWANRYVELKNNFFIYYKKKGDQNSRGIINLSGKFIIERTYVLSDKYIVIQEDDENKGTRDVISIKLNNDISHKLWLKQLTLASQKSFNSAKKELKDDSLLEQERGDNNSIQQLKVDPQEEKNNLDMLDQVSTVSKVTQNLQKQTRRQSISRQNTFKSQIQQKSSLNIPGNLDSELVDESQSDKLLTIKAHVSQMKKESEDKLLLIENIQNIRVFGTPLPKKQQKEIMSIIKGLEQSQKYIFKYYNLLKEKFDSLDQDQGTFYFGMFLSIAFILLTTFFYILIEMTKTQSFLMSFILILNLIFIPMTLDRSFKNAFQIAQFSKKQNQDQSNLCYKIKCQIWLPFNINEILLVFKNLQYRKNWQCHVKDIKENGNLVTMTYLHNNHSISETFQQNLYRENDQIYIVEHNSGQIIRLFQININKNNHQHLMIYYSFSNSDQISQIYPQINPSMLNGLVNYIRDLKLDQGSFLQEYSKKKYIQSNEYTNMYGNIGFQMNNNISDNDDSLLSGDDSTIENDQNKGEIKLKKENQKTENDEISNDSQQKISNKNEQFESQNQQQQQEQQQQQTQQKEDNLFGIDDLNAKYRSVQPQFHNYLKIALDAKDRLIKMHQLLPENEWAYYDQKEDVTIHTKKDQATGLTWSRGQGKIRCKPDQFIEYLGNYDNKKKYDELFNAGQVLQSLTECQSLRINYEKFSSGSSFVQSRDFVLITIRYELQDGTTVLAATSVEHPNMPPQKSTTRAQLILAGWIIKYDENTGLTDLTYVQFNDPKGNIPKSLLAMVTTKQALLVSKIRNNLQK